MVETAAHLVDNVLPRAAYRQWVLSVPKRVRWHLRDQSAGQQEWPDVDQTLGMTDDTWN